MFPRCVSMYLMQIMCKKLKWHFLFHTCLAPSTHGLLLMHQNNSSMLTRHLEKKRTLIGKANKADNRKKIKFPTQHMNNEWFALFWWINIKDRQPYCTNPQQWSTSDFSLYSLFTRVINDYLRWYHVFDMILLHVCWSTRRSESEGTSGRSVSKDTATNFRSGPSSLPGLLLVALNLEGDGVQLKILGLRRICGSNSVTLCLAFSSQHN